MPTSTVRLPTPRAAHPVVRLLRFAWTLPTNLIGHLVGLAVSGGRGVRVVRGAAACGVLYPIRVPGLRRIGAVTLGSAILVGEHFLTPCGDETVPGVRGRLILAHELAHTRQHDALGPFFLPAHVLFQVASAIAYLLCRPGRGDPIHAYNPLEQRWLCLGFDAIFELARGERLDDAGRERLLCAFGV
jgi:hypothetical protein